MIRHILGATIALIAFLLLAAFVGADWQQRGQYWYFGGGNDAYVRSYTPGYTYCGRYYPGQYTYTFSHVYTAPSPGPVPAYNWRQQFLELQKYRTYLETETRDFTAALGALGGVQQSAYSQQYASYGQRYAMNTDFYGDSNTSVLYQQASRLVDTAQGLAKEGLADFQGLVAADAEGRKRIAEILAAGQALSAVVAKQVTTQSTATFGGQTAQPGVGSPWEALAVAKCAGCHSGNKISGGFDVTKFRVLPLSDKIKVLGRITTTDVSRRMPKDGAALTAPEVDIWVREMGK